MLQLHESLLPCFFRPEQVPLNKFISVVVKCIDFFYLLQFIQQLQDPLKSLLIEIRYFIVTLWLYIINYSSQHCGGGRLDTLKGYALSALSNHTTALH